MANDIEENQRRALNKRTARASGNSGIICIPAECIRRTYERYIDTVSGIITLMPTDYNARTFSCAPETRVGGSAMNAARRGPASPRTITIDNSLLAAKNHKNSGSSGYNPRKCEFCKQTLTGNDRQEAPYAAGRYLCTICRAEYMDLHHPPDPFCDVFAKRSGKQAA